MVVGKLIIHNFWQQDLTILNILRKKD